MARTFDGTDDVITTPIGGCDLGFGTFVAIVRRNSTNWNCPISLCNASNVPLLNFNVESNANGNNIAFGDDVSDIRSPTMVLTNANGWCLIAAGKASGTTTPRFHKYVYSTNTWTHENAGGTMPDATTPGPTGVVRLGAWGTGDFFGGDLAIVGFFPRMLIDAEIESLAFSLQNWYASASSGLWLLDQDTTGQKVVDLTGNGANESALVGSTVGATSVPVFNYGQSVIHVTRGAGATQFTQNLAGGISPAGILAKAVKATKSGSVTPSGVAAKSVSISRIGAIMPTGNALKAMLLTQTGSLTPSGILQRAVSSSKAGSVTPTGSLRKDVAKAFEGGITPSGALSALKVILQTLTGAITPSGALTRSIAIARAGAVSPTGSLRSSFAKALSGGITPSGALEALRVVLLLLAGTIAPAGSLQRSIGKSLAGTLTPAGSVIKSIAKALSGAIAAAGSLITGVLQPEMKGDVDVSPFVLTSLSVTPFKLAMVEASAAGPLTTISVRPFTK